MYMSSSVVPGSPGDDAAAGGSNLNLVMESGDGNPEEEGPITSLATNPHSRASSAMPVA